MEDFTPYKEYHVTTQGDTWDTIALKYYEDEHKAQQIMQDRENITLLDYQIFPSGILVHLPILSDEQEAEADMPEWRRL